MDCIDLFKRAAMALQTMIGFSLLFLFFLGQFAPESRFYASTSPSSTVTPLRHSGSGPQGKR